MNRREFLQVAVGAVAGLFLPALPKREEPRVIAPNHFFDVSIGWKPIEITQDQEFRVTLPWKPALRGFYLHVIDQRGLRAFLEQRFRERGSCLWDPFLEPVTVHDGDEAFIMVQTSDVPIRFSGIPRTFLHAQYYDCTVNGTPYDFNQISYTCPPYFEVRGVGLYGEYVYIPRRNSCQK